MKRLLTIAGVILVLANFCQAFVIYKQREVIRAARRILMTSSPQNFEVSTADTPSKGPNTAPIVIVEYSEFTCVFCGRHAETVLPLLDKEYMSRGRVQYIVRTFPLDESDFQSNYMAKAARCSERQGKYWDVYKFLFQRDKSEPFTEAVLDAGSRKLGIDLKQLGECLDDAEIERTLKQDHASGLRAGVEATPTFLIGTRNGKGETMHVEKVVRGAARFEDFQAIIEDLTKKSFDTHAGRAAS